MRKTILLLLVFLFMLCTPVFAQETVNRTIDIRANVIPRDYHLLRGQTIEVRLYAGKTPPGDLVSVVRYPAEELIPERETMVSGRFIANVAIPVFDGTPRHYHIGVGYAGERLHPEYISVIMNASGITSKGPGGWTFNTLTPNITIPLPNPANVIPAPGAPGTAPAPRESYWGNPPPDDSLIAKLFSGFISGIMESLWTFFGIQDPVTLFFNVDPDALYRNHAERYQSEIKPEFWESPRNAMFVDPEGEDTFLYMFNPSEHRMIEGIFNALERYLQIPYVLGLALMGLLLITKGFSGEDKANIKVVLGGLMFFPLLIRVIPYILEPIFWLNFTVVRAVGSVAAGLTDAGGASIDALTRPFTTILIGSGTGLGSVGVLIATFVLFMSVGLLNFQYFVRRFVIAVLIAMFPIVAILQIFPTNRKILGMWFSELLSNLFLQSAHAIVYVIFIAYIYQVQVPVIPAIAMLVTLSTISGLVRNLMGCSSQGGVMGDMVGAGALAGAARIAGDIIGGTKGGRIGSREHQGEEIERPEQPLSPRELDNPLGQAESQETSPGTALAAPSAADTTSGASGTALGPVAVGGLPVQSPSRPWRSPFGTAMGLSPRSSADVGSALRSIGRGALAGSAMAFGSVVGSAAAGDTGLGLGAMLGAKTADSVLGAGGYTAGVVRNRADRERAIEQIQKDMNMGRNEAICYAATGVDATQQEIMFDKGMSDQVVNFSDTYGLHGFRKNWDSFTNEYRRNPGQYLKPGHTYEGVRRDAALMRARLSKQGKHGPSAPEINDLILRHVIRPAIRTAPVSAPTPAYTPAPAPAPPYTSDPMPWYHYTNDDMYALEEKEQEYEDLYGYSNSMRNRPDPMARYWGWST